MKPHSVAIGRLYSDDSGWEALVEVETPQTCWIEIDGERFSLSINQIPWLIEALTTALALVQGDTE